MRPLSLLTLTCLLAASPAWAQGEASTDRALPEEAGDVDARGEPPPRVVTEPQPGLKGTPQSRLLPPPSSTASEGVPEAAITDASRVDGRPRQGPFLAGPGSFNVILHHTLMGAAGGFAVTAIPGGFDFGKVDTRTAMLLGTLVGTGLGFATSSWYQFNHWIDRPAADYGIVNSVIAGMFLTGLVDTFSNDPLVLATSALIGAELGAWLTLTVGTGEFPASRGLMIASGGAWGLIYGALLMATLGNSGTRIDSAEDVVPALLLAPGIGAAVMALASLRYDPSTSQLMRANLFGAAVGSSVLLLTALVAGGFNSPLPYVLGLVSSAAAMSLVSLLWAEDVQKPAYTSTGSIRKPKPYSNVWW